MSADVGSAHVRHLPAAEEDEAHKDHKNVVQKVDTFPSLLADFFYKLLPLGRLSFTTVQMEHYA